MTDRWASYFESQGTFGDHWLQTAVAHWSFHEILFGRIIQNVRPGGAILDVGCGPGWSDLYLSARGFAVTGVDSEPRLVQAARDLAARVGENVRYEVGDAFDLKTFHGQFDLAYSCGVLEHFDRDVTVQLLQEQARCAKQVLIQIPSRYTAYTGPITDERIYSVRELRRIVEDAGLTVVKSFGYGDIATLRWHQILRNALPRAAWRLLQDQGFAFAIAVLGQRHPRP